MYDQEHIDMVVYGGGAQEAGVKLLGCWCQNSKENNTLPNTNGMQLAMHNVTSS
jgi:hypothetical protein